MSLHPSRPAARPAQRSRPAPRLVPEPDGIRMLLPAPAPAPAPVSSVRGEAAAEVSHAVDDAVDAARARRAHHVLTSVEACGPLCAPLLQAARERVGVDVRQVRTRRAGSSVLVDLEPLP